jgi:hypothetical protein
MNDLETGVYGSHTEYERQRNARHYFKRVIEAYIDVQNTPCIAATSYDPFVRNPKLGADLIHYIVDVENASKKALGNSPSLFEQWQRMVDGESVTNAASIVARCARLYQARQLAPTDYFRVIKRGRKRHQAGAS